MASLDAVEYVLARRRLVRDPWRLATIYKVASHLVRDEDPFLRRHFIRMERYHVWRARAERK
jgi:hypothetical protein